MTILKNYVAKEDYTGNNNKNKGNFQCNYKHKSMNFKINNVITKQTKSHSRQMLS